MSKKSHIGWHDIELYLKEKLGKIELSGKKDHLVEEILEMKNDLVNYKNEPQLHKVEFEIYKERIEKNREVLEGLKMIFPEDKDLAKILTDLDKT